MGMMDWAIKMAVHPKAAQEFSLSLQAIQSIMTDAEATREEKREVLNIMVNDLSEGAFKLKPVAEQIMTIINMKKEVCEEYTDSEAQLWGILGWLPRFKQHQQLLLNEVKRHRKEYGLTV